MSASKLIHYFFGYPAEFGIWASLPSDNITLNPANKRVAEWHWYSLSCHFGQAAAYF